MVHAAASSPERVVCVVGEAGAGKTTALAALADAYRRDGHVAIGAAPSGVAAANLAAETGMPSGTLHHLLAQARQQGGLPRGCLLVVDEAAMADTRTLTRALFEVERAEGKAVLVGDPAQLPAVGPGGLFSAIVERNGAIELHDNRRQRDELERRALALLREGRSRDYLAHAAQHGRLTVASDRVEAKAQLVADWWQAARGDLAGSAMIAYRRADVAELNTVARTLLDHEGRLGRDRLRLDSGIELAVGDRILCTRNDRRLEVANGSRGTISAVDREQRAIEVELDDHRRLTLPARYLDAGHVAHAYALTGHKTQGLTVERAFVLADDRRALREWGYVALSRAREQTRLYTTANELEPDAPPHRPEPASPFDRLADALTRPAAETLATDAATTRPEPTERDALARQSRQLIERQLALEKEHLDTTQTPEPDGPAGSPAWACSAAPATAAPSATRSANTTRNSRASTASSSESTEQLRRTRERALELAPTQPRPERGLRRERARARARAGSRPRYRAVSHMSMPMSREIPSVRSIPNSTSMIRRSSRDRSTANCRNRSASRPGSRPSSCAYAADIRARSATDATRTRKPAPMCSTDAPRRRSLKPRRVPAGSATTFSSPNEVRNRKIGSARSDSSSTDSRRRSTRLASSSAECRRQPIRVAGSATRDRHPHRLSPHPCRGSPAPTRQSTRSSRHCDATPPTAHADRTRSPPAHPTRASATFPWPLRRLEPRAPLLHHPVQPPLRRQHLDLLNPLIRTSVIRHQLQRDIEPARAQQLHQRVQARRHHPLLVPGDHRPILAAHVRQLVLAQPRAQPRLPQNRRAPHRVLTHATHSNFPRGFVRYLG